MGQNPVHKWIRYWWSRHPFYFGFIWLYLGVRVYGFIVKTWVVKQVYDVLVAQTWTTLASPTVTLTSRHQPLQGAVSVLCVLFDKDAYFSKCNCNQMQLVSLLATTAGNDQGLGSSLTGITMVALQWWWWKHRGSDHCHEEWDLLSWENIPTLSQ